MRITLEILLHKVDPSSQNTVVNVPASKSKIKIDPAG